MRMFVSLLLTLGGIVQSAAAEESARVPTFDALPPFVLAQAGSTGGTIGKQGKSISGGEDENPPRQPAPPSGQRTSCPNIVGVWNSWASGLFGKADTTFGNDGTAKHRSGIPGTWKCESGQLVMTWGSGGVEHFTLSPDRKKIIRSDGAVGFSRD
ncbi:MAG: hypothetical protein HY659_12555 [Rhizobiales bacterium]|nr:hypothetical protein [Hyphomicrobiales bacterium]